MENIHSAKGRIVGTKQVVKAAAAGKLAKAYLAEDTEPFISKKILDACAANSVPVIPVSTMAELGEACGIEVGAACVGIIK